MRQNDAICVFTYAGCVDGGATGPCGVPLPTAAALTLAAACAAAAGVLGGRPRIASISGYWDWSRNWHDTSDAMAAASVLQLWPSVWMARTLGVRRSATSLPQL